MKLSELIERLQEVFADRGDLTVYAWPYDGQGSLYDPELNVTYSSDAGESVLYIEG